MKSAELAQFSKLSLFKQFTGSKYYGVNDARNSKCTSDDCTDLKIKKRSILHGHLHLLLCPSQMTLLLEGTAPQRCINGNIVVPNETRIIAKQDTVIIVT